MSNHNSISKDDKQPVTDKVAMNVTVAMEPDSVEPNDDITVVTRTKDGAEISGRRY